jgi:hypothetical protein
MYLCENLVVYVASNKIEFIKINRNNMTDIFKRTFPDYSMKISILTENNFIVPHPAELRRHLYKILEFKYDMEKHLNWLKEQLELNDLDSRYEYDDFEIRRFKMTRESEDEKNDIFGLSSTQFQMIFDTYSSGPVVSLFTLDQVKVNDAIYNIDEVATIMRAMTR